ncbi:hypothetical protein EG68_11868 [Paragonimus skrjabini miyazakii]|uniref:Uncharacterized protein n=1 Tax=Paragonimus skrjabini miyazakii TaxID=59628 RepID=A0A8S9YL24_9TREM|nr:hypothetical protein EG68_11868 [Paragonimus skrjabini miyazakii]
MSHNTVLTLIVLLFGLASVTGKFYEDCLHTHTCSKYPMGILLQDKENSHLVGILIVCYTSVLAQSVHLRKVTLNDCDQEEDICSLDRNETMRLKIKFHTSKQNFLFLPKLR